MDVPHDIHSIPDNYDLLQVGPSNFSLQLLNMVEYLEMLRVDETLEPVNITPQPCAAIEHLSCAMIAQW